MNCVRTRWSLQERIRVVLFGENISTLDGIVNWTRWLKPKRIFKRPSFTESTLIPIPSKRNLLTNPILGPSSKDFKPYWLIFLYKHILEETEESKSRVFKRLREIFFFFFFFYITEQITVPPFLNRKQSVLVKKPLSVEIKKIESPLANLHSPV